MKSCIFDDFLLYLTINLVPLHTLLIIESMAKKNLNRIKVMLAERNQTNKWLAEQVGKDPATVSKWVTNASQPSLEVIFKIAEVLKCNYTDLIRDVEEQDPIIN